MRDYVDGGDIKKRLLYYLILLRANSHLSVCVNVSITDCSQQVVDLNLKMRIHYS